MKIQNKRSGVEGKEPTAGQTEYGELCINFHEGDPALYIKDTNDVIRRVGADITNYYTKDEIEGLDWDTSVADGRYLRVDADAPDQVRLAGDVEFKGLIKTAGGIYASGFSNDNFLATNANIFIANPDDPNGSNATYQFFNTSGWFKATGYNATYGDYLYTTSARGNGVFEVVRATNPDSGGSTGNGSTIVTDFRLNITGGGIASHQTNHRIGAVKGVVSQRDDFRNTQACGDRRHYAFVGSASPESDQIAADADKQGKAGGYVFFQTDNKTGIKDLVAFDVDHQGIDGQDFVAFNSRLRARTGSNNFNLNFSGDAPNFLAGSTYIGGTTARNTFELWKSTLTEEQVEQFEAGTLVAPANVSVPGDGSFARQWWYDQQDEETQTLLDSGDLEYPEYLAAETFTDVFDLGDNTKINLLSNGHGVFTSGVKITSNSSDNVHSTGMALYCGANQEVTEDYASVSTQGRFEAYKNYDDNLGDYKQSLQSNRSGSTLIAARRTSPTDSGSSTGSTYGVESRMFISSGGISNNSANQRIAAHKGLVVHNDDFVNTSLNTDQRMYGFASLTTSNIDQINGTDDQKGKAGGFVYFEDGGNFNVADVIGFHVDTAGKPGQKNHWFQQ